MSDANVRAVPFRDPQEDRSAQMIAALVPLALALLLILFNWDEVNLNLLFWDVDVPLGLVLLLLFVLGAATGWLAPRLLARPERSRVHVTTVDDPPKR